MKTMRLLPVVLGLALLSGLAPAATPLQGEHEFDIPAQRLSDALNAFGRQTGLSVAFYDDAVADRESDTVLGHFTAEEALGKLLVRSGLHYRFVNEKTVAISKEEAGDGNKISLKAAGDSALRMAQAGGEAGSQQNSDRQGATEGTSGDSAGAKLEEVVVTAQKRKERLQDVPMSISAITANDIARRGLADVGEILNSVPGVSNLDQGPGFNSIVIRGITLSPETETGGAITGVYFGDTSISGLGILGNSADIKLIDMERVEVLRGPQGTLYGAGAMGGVVRYIPVAPKLGQWSGDFTSTYSNTARGGDDNTSIQGVLNVPLVKDVLALRVSGYHFDNSGYYNNVAASDPFTAASVTNFGAVALNQDNVGSSTYTGGRASLLWRPVEQFSATLTYLHQNLTQDGWAQTDLGVGDGLFSQRRLQLRSRQSPPDYGQPSFNEGIADKIDLSNLVLDYDLDWAGLTSSTSYVEEDSDLIRELADFFGGIPTSQPTLYRARSVTEEMRLTSKLHGPLQFMAGLYYEARHAKVDNIVLFGGNEDLDFLHNVVWIKNAAAAEVKQKAAFGELSYRFLQKWVATAGARYFSFDTSGISHRFASAFSPTDTAAGFEGGSQSDATFKLSAEYRPTQSAMLYGTWSQGFRPGQVVAPIAVPSCDQNQDGIIDGSNGISTGQRVLDSDTLDNYELGGKFTSLNGRIQINTALYDIEWKGIPVSKLFGLCTATVNAGKAQSRGVELETTLAATDSLTFNLSGSYKIDAKLTQDAPQIGGSKGDRLPGSAKYNMSAGTQYRYSLLSHNAFVRADYFYVGGFFNNLKQTGTEIGNYGMLDLSAGVEINNAQLMIFAKNATNRTALTWVDSDVNVFERGNRLRPRTIGLQLGYSFK